MSTNGIIASDSVEILDVAVVTNGSDIELGESTIMYTVEISELYARVDTFVAGKVTAGSWTDSR